jgi:hypothetical protein
LAGSLRLRLGSPHFLVGWTSRRATPCRPDSSRLWNSLRGCLRTFGFQFGRVRGRPSQVFSSPGVLCLN